MNKQQPDSFGATEFTEFIPLSVPEIRGNEWLYLKECLDTNWVSSEGPFVTRFEEELADYLGARFAVATVNGTSALHVALLVAGVQPDDEVLIPSLTFVAPTNAIRYTGAWPVFMDVEPRYWQLDPNKTKDFLENECGWKNGALHNKSSGRRIRGILPVHILGHPCDMDPILELAERYKLVVIEDASESLGAKYQGQVVGRMGDVSCFSFNGNKVMTTGGGGMVVTDNQDWASRVKYLTTQAKDDQLEYVHNEIGFNYRLTNIQAAVGLAQLELLDEFLEVKRGIAARYDVAFRELEDVTRMPVQPGVQPIHWLYTVLLPPDTTLDKRKTVVKFLNESGIGSRPLWHPIHSLPPYLECQSYRVDTATNLYHRAISLPCSVGLTEDHQDRAIAAVKEGLRLL